MELKGAMAVDGTDGEECDKSISPDTNRRTLEKMICIKDIKMKFCTLLHHDIDIFKISTY